MVNSPGVRLRHSVNGCSFMVIAVRLFIPMTRVPVVGCATAMGMIPHVYRNVVPGTFRIHGSIEVIAAACECGQGCGGHDQAQKAGGDYLTSHEGTSTELNAIILTVPALSRVYQLSTCVRRPWPAFP